MNPHKRSPLEEAAAAALRLGASVDELRALPARLAVTRTRLRTALANPNLADNPEPAHSLVLGLAATLRRRDDLALYLLDEGLRESQVAELADVGTSTLAAIVRRARAAR